MASCLDILPPSIPPPTSQSLSVAADQTSTWSSVVTQAIDIKMASFKSTDHGHPHTDLNMVSSSSTDHRHQQALVITQTMAISGSTDHGHLHGQHEPQTPSVPLVAVQAADINTVSGGNMPMDIKMDPYDSTDHGHPHGLQWLTWTTDIHTDSENRTMDLSMVSYRGIDHKHQHSFQW